MLIADEDSREFNDLIITYFSGFSFENQVRRRHDHYEELLGSRRRRWLITCAADAHALYGEFYFYPAASPRRWGEAHVDGRRGSVATNSRWRVRWRGAR